MSVSVYSASRRALATTSQKKALLHIHPGAWGNPKPYTDIVQPGGWQKALNRGSACVSLSLRGDETSEDSDPQPSIELKAIWTILMLSA